MLAAAGVLAQPTQRIVVRASPGAAPCARAAARTFADAHGGARIDVIAGRLVDAGAADILVAVSGAEMTRAIEAGRTDEASRIVLARIPWVLSLGPHVSSSIQSMDDYARSSGALAVWDDPAGYEAERWARERFGARLTRLGAARDEAAAALLPLSVAHGERLLEVAAIPPLIAEASLGRSSSQRQTAEAFLRFLDTRTGREAFAACARSDRR
ncbi:MAG: substrate-binding domain-containing protein [Vicinamibacteria bacterium]|nr:substrate-binding domain-containing protein [Vicinamibacteria bacterium]